MPAADVLLLVGAGLAAGYVAGLLGVGGGIIFAPVLLFYFDATGVAAEVIPSLTVGTSLLCTLLAACGSAWHQFRRGAVLLRVAVVVGGSSAVAVFLMTRFVTTQPWYTQAVFQTLFGVLLLVVVGRMVRRRPAEETYSADGPRPAFRTSALVGIGSAAGVVSSAAGVGGGVVLVPAYHGLLRLPIHRTVGTSSATIVLISLLGVLGYATTGGDAATPGSAVGYVDVVRGGLLAVPSLLSAQAGVWTAHRIDTRALRLTFAVLGVGVATRLLWEALA
jgi:hypothetical protein